MFKRYNVSEKYVSMLVVLVLVMNNNIIIITINSNNTINTQYLQPQHPPYHRTITPPLPTQTA
jgi:hypothetical protein